MTLKTLKDIQDKYKEAAKLYMSSLLKAMNVTEQELREHSDPEFKPLDGSDDMVSAKELRQSAIEWIKLCRTKKITFAEKNKFDVSSKMFELFFNITEDDLK